MQLRCEYLFIEISTHANGQSVTLVTESIVCSTVITSVADYTSRAVTLVKSYATKIADPARCSKKMWSYLVVIAPMSTGESKLECLELMTVGT